MHTQYHKSTKKESDIMAILTSVATPQQEQELSKGIEWVNTEEQFEWFYDEKEVCLILEGEALIDAHGEEVRIKAGDYVIFPAGLHCSWKVLSPIKKRYKLL